MAINDAGIRLITEFEGFVDHWYPDPAHGWNVPTVGYGHTDAAGDPKYAATKGKTFTKAEGIEILRRDLGQYEAAVRKYVKVPLNDNEFAALTSFTFNLGATNLAKSTLVKKLNAGDRAGAAGEFKKWNKAGGKVLAGLTRRREAERQLFLAPSATNIGTKPVPIEQDDPIVYAPDPEPDTRRMGVVGWLIVVALIVGAIAYVITKPIGA